MAFPPENVHISYLDSSIASNNYVWDSGTLSWVPMEGTSGVGSNVSVTNFPASQTVNDGGLSLTVDGTVSIANFPATQPVSGTVSATQGTSPWVGNTTQLGGTAIDTGSGASSAGTQRVILATNQPVIPVSDNGSSLTVDGTVTANQGTANTPLNAWPVAGSTQALLQDSFGKLITAQPRTVFNSKEDLAQKVLLWSSLTATGGSVTYDSTTSSNTLAVTTSNGSRAVRQSKTYCPYSPGKGTLAIMTGVIGSGQTGTNKRIGMYDDNNGLFFQLSGTTKQVVVRNNASDTSVDQTSWNIDTMDGLGASGITIDWTKAQIFFISFQWLGVGRIVFGFNVNGKDYPCHQILNANSVTNVYMQTPVLPVRYEIVNTAGVASTASLKQICSTIQIMAGIDEYGSLFSCNNRVTAKSVNALTPVLILRPQSGTPHPPFLITSFDIMTTSNSSIYWELVINPTLGAGTAPTYNAVHANSYFEFDVACTQAVSAGQLVASGYLSAQGRSLQNNNFGVDTNLIGADISGNRDILVLAAATIGGGASNMYGSFNWLEIC